MSSKNSSKSCFATIKVSDFQLTPYGRVCDKNTNSTSHYAGSASETTQRKIEQHFPVINI